MKETTNTPLKTPRYIILEKINNTKIETECDCCGRALLHVNYIKDTETGETLHLGTKCTKNYTGKSLHEIRVENKDFDKDTKAAAAYEDYDRVRKTYVQSFKEASPEMMEYIENNLHNSYIESMKKRIEEKGTLTKNQYATVYSMMLEVAKLPAKFTDLEFRAIHFQKKENDFGISYFLLGETEDHKLVRVFFSSMNEKHNNLMLDNKIYDQEGFISSNIFDMGKKFKVSGSFDGYKVKRAKLQEA